MKTVVKVLNARHLRKEERVDRPACIGFVGQQKELEIIGTVQRVQTYGIVNAHKDKHGAVGLQGHQGIGLVESRIMEGRFLFGERIEGVGLPFASAKGKRQ